MEIDEAAARILRRHWPLIVCCCLLPLLALLALSLGRARSYVSHARVMVAGTAPRSAAEADGLVSQARALVTSRSLVAKAVAQAKVDRNPAAVADHVAVTGLGSSPVVDLAVSDTSPRVAQQVTAALAGQLVSALNKAGEGRLPQVLQAIDNQLTDLAVKRARFAADAKTNPQDPVVQNRLAGIDRLISDLSGDRNRLAVEAAVQGQTQVVDPAKLPTGPEPSGLVQKGAIAVLLGLTIGILLAAGLETARPTVPGVGRLGRLLDAPVLGRLTAAGGDRELRDAGRIIRLAARRASAYTVVLVGTTHRPVPGQLIADIANEVVLDGADGQSVPRRPGVPASGNGTAPPPQRPRPKSYPLTMADRAGTPGALSDSQVAAVNAAIATVDAALASVDEAAVTSIVDAAGEPRLPRRVCQLDDLDLTSEQRPVGVVLLAPRSIRLSVVSATRDLLAASGWALLGVVEVPAGALREGWR